MTTTEYKLSRTGDLWARRTTFDRDVAEQWLEDGESIAKDIPGYSRRALAVEYDDGRPIRSYWVERRPRELPGPWNDFPGRG